jgi:hypothetical protein
MAREPKEIEEDRGGRGSGEAEVREESADRNWRDVSLRGWRRLPEIAQRTE